MHDPSRVRVTVPREPFAVGFAAALRVDGYTARGISGQLYLMAHLSRWLAEEHLGSASLTGPVVERFVVARRALGMPSFVRLGRSSRCFSTCASSGRRRRRARRSRKGRWRSCSGAFSAI
jgi:hypothetical protein